MNKIQKNLLTFLMMSLLLFFLAACGSNGVAEDDGETKEGTLKVVSSFTIITDIAENIGGDYVDVHNLVPTGTDPHEYEPLPEDIKKATDADILFYNGLNLEGGEIGRV